MPFNRRDFLKASAAGAVMLKQGMMTLGAPVDDIQVAIDAARTGEPATSLILRGAQNKKTKPKVGSTRNTFNRRYEPCD
jgi:hypothetical protein